MYFWKCPPCKIHGKSAGNPTDTDTCALHVIFNLSIYQEFILFICIVWPGPSLSGDLGNGPKELLPKVVVYTFISKLDKIGPTNNRPSTD